MNLHPSIALEPITTIEQPLLLALMQEIYPPVYAYLWEDAGKQYLKTTYSKKQFLEEMQENGAHYFFVYYQQKRIGIFKYNLNKDHSIKVHRLYLHPNTHGLGIGSNLLRYLERKYHSAFKKIWLEAMASQNEALEFYQNRGFTVQSNYQLPYPLMHTQYRKIYVLQKSLSC